MEKQIVQKRFRVQLQLKSLRAIAGLDVDHGCMPRRKLEDGTIEMVAVVSGGTLKKLRRKRTVKVEVLGDANAEAAQAASEVSRTNRYADGSLPVARGLQGVRRVD